MSTATATRVPTVHEIPAASHDAVAALPESVAIASQPIFDWWMHHWMDASHPMARLQRAWMESILEAIQVEAEFLNACAASGEKMSKCFSDPDVLQSPASLGSCCHEVAREMTDAHISRLGKVAELPKDFRQRLWEEIC
ncbi:hypothetical protein [Halomonas sp. C05BenzN]|uniref:hypothetical protein n=1 Tax=Halomonas sp. C05BenzN TaxID=3411041 RepID=UPI003B92331E